MKIFGNSRKNPLFGNENKNKKQNGNKHNKNIIKERTVPPYTPVLYADAGQKNGMAYRNNFKQYKDPNKKSFNLYNLFSGDGSGKKGVSKKDRITDYSVLNFFKLYVRNFGKMIQVNLLFLFGNFPIFFYLFARSGNLSIKSLTSTHLLNSSFHGVMVGGDYNPVTAALNGIIGYQTVNYVPTTAVYVFIALSALAIFTFGPVNVGCAYILRNIVKQEPIFLMSDFFYAIKRNRKQSLIYGILDAGFCALIVYDIIFFYYNIGSSFFMNVSFYMSLVVAVLYFVMRFYMYVMMLTFDLKLFKMLKNALIFALLGFKRNFMAIFGMVFFLFMCYGLFLTYPPLGILTPILLIFGTCAFIATYAAWPKIKQVMIDPYYKEEEKETDTEEPVFRDMG